MRNGDSGGTAAAVSSHPDDCCDPDCDACHFAREVGIEPSTRRCINRGVAPGVQAPAHATPVLEHGDTGELVTVVMTKIDALLVGQTLRGLARDKKTPLGVREQLSRVGAQMTSEAGLAMKAGAR